jgi:hypothetical protein
MKTANLNLFNLKTFCYNGFFNDKFFSVFTLCINTRQKVNLKK